MGLNENIKAHRLVAEHGGGQDDHSLIHDDPLGSRYQVRIDVWGKDHREQADRIVRAVNSHDALLEALEGIANQRTLAEVIAAGDYDDSDFEGGYDAIVKIARTALTSGEDK